MALLGLTPAERDHFIAHGFVHLRGCFPAGPGTLARRWVDDSWARSGVDPRDPASWPEAPVVLPRTAAVRVSEFAPRVHAAIADLLGGPELVKDPGLEWGDNFLINYAVGADAPWVPPGPAAPAGQNWHIDGNWFRHFLDSPEQGLLGLVMWTDLVHRGGATFIAPDSVAGVARHLLAHPEGLEPDDFSWGELIGRASDFREVLGEAGDVVLIHPLVMHRGSQNQLRRLRVISNAVSSQREPLRFRRADGAYTPVERVILEALGESALDYAITGTREWLDPRRKRRA
jgi:hypothetical protein